MGEFIARSLTKQKYYGNYGKETNVSESSDSSRLVEGEESVEFFRSKIDRLTKRKKDLMKDGDFLNIVNIIKIKDNELLD